MFVRRNLNFNSINSFTKSDHVKSVIFYAGVIRYSKFFAYVKRSEFLNIEESDLGENTRVVQSKRF
jgi:hypothetical protein